MEDIANHPRFRDLQQHRWRSRNWEVDDSPKDQAGGRLIRARSDWHHLHDSAAHPWPPSVPWYCVGYEPLDQERKYCRRHPMKNPSGTFQLLRSGCPMKYAAPSFWKRKNADTLWKQWSLSGIPAGQPSNSTVHQLSFGHTTAPSKCHCPNPRASLLY